jgi:hypothetical protein
MTSTPRDKRLILHIGTHKTGSSSFQRSLMLNERVPAERGVGVIRERDMYAASSNPNELNLTSLSHLSVRPELPTPMRLKNEGRPHEGAIRRALLRRLWARDLAKRPKPVLIGSAESFCFLRTPREARQLSGFLAAIRRDLVVLLVARDEAEWRASWRAQLEKRPKVREGLAKVDPSVRIDGDWYFDLAATRAFWSALGEVREIDYDAEIAVSGNIVSRLYREAGIDPEGLETSVRINARPDGEQRGRR